jgi:acyl-CoA thioester hydrolase
MTTFTYRETVRFRDLDALGHVNNAVFLTYMESARTAWAMQQGLMTGVDDLPLILARVEVDFRAPVELGETVEVTIRPGRVGTKSFDLEYELRADGRVVAEGRSVLVGYDYAASESIPIPDEWRKLLRP